jgi:hypothetical protein
MEKIFLLICILLASCNGEHVYYVSSSGDDGNPGTELQPFATIVKARDVARKTGSAVTVYLRQGVYYLAEPVIFAQEDARREHSPLRIAVYPGEKVTVSGAILLEGLQWQPWRDGIMQVKVAQDMLFDRLFVNGQLQPMARYPNFDPAASHYNGTAADALAPERVAKWTNPAGGYVHTLHKHEWGGYHWLITGKNEKNELSLEGGYQNNRLMGMHDRFRFVENILEELDAPGEWYFDRSSKTLYFYPPDGMDLAKACMEAPQLKELFVFKGSEQQPVENISIEGLELTHTLRTFMETREPLLRSDWAIFRSGTVRMEGTEHCSVRNCFFNEVGGNAIFFSNYNRHNEVSGCHIAGAGASGVCFVGDPAAVRSPSFEYNEFTPVEELDVTPGPKTNNYPDECLVYDNLMHDLGRVEKQAAGVQISMSQSITVSHNTICDLPRAGVNISEGAWGGHILEYNDVFNTVLETGDHGSFNSWGRDRYWHPRRNEMNRRVADHPDLILLDAVKTTIIRNNRFRCDHGWDIDLDDGSSNYHIYNNLCLNGGLKLREGFYRTVENNIMVNNSFHPHVWFANSGDIFKHNIVTAPYFPIQVKDWGEEVDDNAFPDEASLQKAQANGTDRRSVYGPAEFVNPAAGDYRVQESSVALTVGFKNFDMDQFGVVSPELKVLAKKTPLPELLEISGDGDRLQQFSGMKLRNVTTLGDRSAAGLSEISGVWVVAVPDDVRFGEIFQANDVILAANGKKITNVSDLRKACRVDDIEKITFTVSRNQKEQKVKLSTGR